MNHDETMCFIRGVSTYRPDFAAWWSEQVGITVRATGLDEGAATNSMFDSVCRQLAEIDAGEAIDLLSRLESGEAAIPVTAGGYPRWESFVGFVRSSVLDDRRRRRDLNRRERESEPRFHCLHCLDAGSVLVYYPPFVEWLRPTFEEYQRGVFPAGWFQAASQAWYGRAVRKEVKAPATLPLACHCQSPAARTFRSQVSRMREAIAAGGVGRAAFVGVWNPERQCRCGGAEAEELARWYATHRPNESYEWQPDLMQYAGGEKFEDE